jgi:predicted alpha/beta hydrolase
MRCQDKRIVASDGFGLAATLFAPDPRRYGGRVVVVASAMGVKRGFYRHYAFRLAEEGLPVVTFDYRGIGGSVPGSPRGFDASLRDWGTKDLTGVIDWAREVFPEASVLLVAHSVGGQILGLAANRDVVHGVVAVASQSGYWGHWSGASRFGVWLLWHLLMPVLTRVRRSFPARLLRLGEDIPSGVAREWAYWGRHPQYLMGRLNEEARRGYEQYHGAVRAYSFTDDAYAPESAVKAFLRFYPGARREHRRIDPGDLDLKSIGHFGFFRQEVGDLLWHETAAWLASQRPEPVGVTPGN